MAFALLFSSHGCAWRVGDAAHYFGPVLFRYGQVDIDSPATTEIRAIGILGEGGQQWGISLGVIQRVATAPRYMSRHEAASVSSPEQRLQPFSLLLPARPDGWNLSPVYLRLPGAAGVGLVVRRLYGVQLVAGLEARAFSIGMTSATHVQFPEDSLSLVHYDARAPLAARFWVWRPGPDGDLPSIEILEETRP